MTMEKRLSDPFKFDNNKDKKHKVHNFKWLPTQRMEALCLKNDEIEMPMALKVCGHPCYHRPVQLFVDKKPKVLVLPSLFT